MPLDQPQTPSLDNKAAAALLAEWRGRRARLLEAADFIETVPEKQFTMDHWWLSDGTYYDEERNKRVYFGIGPCGCAVGHLANSKDPRFHYLTPQAYTNTRPDIVYCNIADLFGITQAEAEFIFSQYAYSSKPPTPFRVAERMRFVARELSHC